MTNSKGFLSFWTTFPGVLTAAAVAMIGTTGLIVLVTLSSSTSERVSCQEYLNGREDVAACNSATDPGYFWSRVSKTEHYSVGGVSAVGGEPRCGNGTVGARGMSARFPLDDATFLAVRESYENNDADPAAPGCNFALSGEQTTDRDLAGICGLFVFECSEQRP